jgi:crotonobetainyl-CoA:carnitine CoA-transferase CaiB-like acyl-CoA transferase
MTTENPLAHSPHIGQHSREILAELGMSAKEIEALVGDGTVATTDMPRAAE